MTSSIHLPSSSVRIAPNIQPTVSRTANDLQPTRTNRVGRFSMAFLSGFCLLLLGTLGCAGGVGMSQEEVVANMSTLGSLQTRLARAEELQLDVLAPSGLKNAQEAFDQAVSTARRGETQAAERQAQTAIELLDQAQVDAVRTSTVLRDVLAQRQRARKAGAPELLSRRFEAVEDEMREASALIESGDIEGAQDVEPELLRSYSSLELDSLKVDATELAQKAIDAARDAGAERYASDTFGRAKKELTIALGILETDRGETARANIHARRASELATRSSHIVDLVKEFDRRDYNSEAVVLWYQEQLEEVLSPLDDDVTFTTPNHEVVSGAKSRIAGLVEGESSARAELAEARLRIDDLELTSTVSEADLKARLTRLESDQREAQARYDRIQGMFSEAEATVYRQGLNVLLEAHGFDFPVGKSEIQSSNFPLLNKIAKAIREFDEPNVVVSGHTDATGDNKANQTLSEERAQKVGNFLVEVSEVDKARVQTRGFGESKPVATNESADGRARNRRIEILIVNR